jgi:AraC-like DNA-binding protein
MTQDPNNDPAPETDVSQATARLLDAAVELGASAPAPRDEAAATRVFESFIETYRGWIIAHHDLPGSQPERVERSHLLLHAMASATTLGEALAVLLRFARLVWAGRGVCELREAGHATMVVYQQAFRPGPPGLVSELWTLSFQISELEFLVGGKLDGVTGQVRQDACLPPSVAALLFDRPLIYEAAELALTIPRRHLQRAVVARAADIPGFLKRALPRAVGADRSRPEVAGMVAGLLQADRVQQLATPGGLEDVSRRLGYSPATLRRRLAAEGVSFRGIKDRVFDELAKAWLLDGLPVQTIAERLDYSDAFAFRRAFRRRYGCSPSAFARRAAYVPST